MTNILSRYIVLTHYFK